MLIKKKVNITELQRLLLFLFIVCLPFINFPKAYTSSLIGCNLAIYPLLLGLSCFCYDLYHNKIRLDNIYIIYPCIFICWQLLCTGIGLINYKYFYMIDLIHMDKLQLFIEFCSNHGFEINHGVAIKLWLALRLAKSLIKNWVIIFGIPLWIYHLYHYKWNIGFKDIRTAVLLISLIMCCYSAIEMFYLSGFTFASNILIKINPFLYDVASSHGWWPPLLWQGQLRSVMAEPSYFGIISAIIIPLLFSCIFESSKFRYILLYFFYLIMLFLSKTRTGLIVYLGELFLLVVVFLIYYRPQWKKILIILVCSICAFLTTLIFFNNDVPDKNLSASANTYVEQNIASVIGNKRSNSARHINTFATIKVGLQHPLFGVGQGLKDAYINNNLTTEDLTNNEVHIWSKYIHQDGILRSTFPILNYFAYIFASFGVIGLLLYIIPIIYIFIRLYLQRDVLRNNIQLGCVLIAFCGSIATLFSNGDFFLNIYILYGLLLCRTDYANFER